MTLCHGLSNGKRHEIWYLEYVKMDLREIGIDGANWIRLAQDRVQWWAFVNTVTNLRVPYKSRMFSHELSDNKLFK
jgi:hypothetical protein